MPRERERQMAPNKRPSFFSEDHQGIIDLLAICDGLDKRLKGASLMQKGVKHTAASPEISSASNTCHREKLPVTASSDPSLWLLREREKERRRDPLRGYPIR